MCSMTYLEPVRIAVLCVLPCREHQRNGKRRGKGLLWLWAHSVVYTLALWFSLSLSFLGYLCQRHPSKWLISTQCLEKGFLSVFLELIEMACQFSSYSNNCVTFILVNWFVRNMPVVNIVCPKLREDFLSWSTRSSKSHHSECKLSS